MFIIGVAFKGSDLGGHVSGEANPFVNDPSTAKKSFRDEVTSPN